MVAAPLESDLLRSFLAVVEAGSVTAAAPLVGRTQSAVSLQIKRLEESLGQVLFLRKARGVAPTSRGEQLVPYARRIVALLDEAAVTLREKPLTGPVRVGIPVEYSTTILPRVLAAFDARHEGVDVSIRCDHSESQLRALRRDELDIAVIYDWTHGDKGEILATDPTVWVTSTVHNQHLRKPVPIAVYFNSRWSRDFAEESLDRLRIDWRPAWSCDMAAGMRTAVVNGIAIAPLSRSSIPEGCRELTADDGFPVVDAARVVLRRNPRGSSPVIEQMTKVLRDAFESIISGQAPGADSADGSAGPFQDFS